jgi:hypothetical protein
MARAEVAGGHPRLSAGRIIAAGRRRRTVGCVVSRAQVGYNTGRVRSAAAPAA